MSYRLDPDEINRIAHECCLNRGTGSLEQLLRAITSALAARYPGQIEENWDWIFTVAGGGNQQITMLHLSLAEYLTIVCCPVPNGGFGGRYLSTVYDTIVDGELLYYSEGQFTPSSFTPGGAYHIALPPGQGHYYAVPSHLCMVEYARGPIPTMFVLPIVQTLFATLDFRSLWKLVRSGTRLMLRGPSSRRR